MVGVTKNRKWEQFEVDDRYDFGEKELENKITKLL